MNAKKINKLTKILRRHLKLAFVPHRANQYRPHLIRRYGLVAVIVTVIAIQGGYNYATTGVVLGEKTPVEVSVLLEETNRERQQKGLNPLVVDTRLSDAAFLKARDMFRQQYWAHTAPDGTTPWYWLAETDYNYTFAGENLAKNFRSSEAVVAAWMASPEHKKNVLSTNFVQAGFAVVDGKLNGKDTTLIVALYGAPAASGVAGTRTVPAVGGVAPDHYSAGPLTQLGVAIRSMSPAVLGSVFVMLLLTGVALLAHAYRNKLPRVMRESWYRHHGLIKVGGMMSLVVVMVFLYSGGQI